MGGSWLLEWKGHPSDRQHSLGITYCSECGLPQDVAVLAIREGSPAISEEFSKKSSKV